jgi:hypothetical protein
MTKHNIWEPVKTQLVSQARILTSIWVIKKKANGTYRARINARGFEQEDGVLSKGNYGDSYLGSNTN